MKIAAIGLALGLVAAGCAGTGGSAASQANLPTADVSGTWIGTFTGGNMNVPLIFTLQQNGDKVTGNLDGMRLTYGGDIQGVVRGNEFSWRARGGPGAGDLVVNGNEMTGIARYQYGDGKMVLRRRQ